MTEYRVGQRVTCDKWCEDRWEECAGGIHFSSPAMKRKPYWSADMTSARHKFQPTADSLTLNITDHWQTATDPENARGEYVEALFRVSYENGTIRRPMGLGFSARPVSCDVHHMIGATVGQRRNPVPGSWRVLAHPRRRDG